MHGVGKWPHPERKYFIDQIMERNPRYAYLYQIRPGVTSYATFFNGYCDTVDKMLQKIRQDTEYSSPEDFLKRRVIIQ